MWFLIRKCIQKQNSTDIYRFKKHKEKRIKRLMIRQMWLSAYMLETKQKPLSYKLFL